MTRGVAARERCTRAGEGAEDETEETEETEEKEETEEENDDEADRNAKGALAVAETAVNGLVRLFMMVACRSGLEERGT